MGMLLSRHRTPVNVTVQADVEGKTQTATKDVNIAPSEIQGEHTYNRSDILTMNVAGLRELAEKNGINPDQSGSKLKTELLKKLGL